MGLGTIFLSRTALEVYAVIALALFAAGLKHGYDDRRRDEGRAEIQSKWDADKAERLRAYTAMTTKWITAQTDAEKAIKERDDARAHKFDQAKTRAAELPEHLAAMPVPFESVVVLNDAIRQSSVAGPAGKSEDAAAGPAADSTVGAFTQWGTGVIDMYDACRERVRNWESFYDTLRKQQEVVK